MIRTIVLLQLMFCVSCVTMRTGDFRGGMRNQRTNESNQLMVVIDEDLSLYNQVITGIHVASRGNYRMMHLHEEGFLQSAFLEELLTIKPRAIIALGPRATNAIASSRVILPSAFSMVPRVDNYEIESVFLTGIRMIPDIKEQIALVRSLLPNLKALGVVFSKQNSRNSILRVRSLCDDEQFELVNIEVQSTSDVLPALMRNHSEFGAVLMLDDPLLADVDVITAMIDFLSSQNIALFGLDCSMVEAGALAAFGTNFFSLGRELAETVLPERAPRLYQSTVIKDPREVDLCFNLSTARKIGNKEQLLSRMSEYGAQKRFAIRTFQ